LAFVACSRVNFTFTFIYIYIERERERWRERWREREEKAYLKYSNKLKERLSSPKQ